MIEGINKSMDIILFKTVLLNVQYCHVLPNIGWISMSVWESAHEKGESSRKLTWAHYFIRIADTCSFAYIRCDFMILIRRTHNCRWTGFPVAVRQPTLNAGSITYRPTHRAHYQQQWTTQICYQCLFWITWTILNLWLYLTNRWLLYLSQQWLLMWPGQRKTPNVQNWHKSIKMFHDQKCTL